MHERQVAVSLCILLVLSVIFINNSFGEKYQHNTQGIDEEDTKENKDGEDSKKFRDWKRGNGNQDEILNEHNVHYKIDELQKQIMDLQNQISDIVLRIIYWNNIQGIPEDIADGDNDTLNELNCNENEIAKWNGIKWICSIDVGTSQSPIFFHYSSIDGGKTQWVGISSEESSVSDSDRPSLLLPYSGSISNLHVQTVKSGDAPSPGGSESYTMTIIKNGSEETKLSCTIIGDNSSCENTELKIVVSAGDTLILKVQASSFANSAIIISSVLYTS